jgi:ABC-type Fe3+-hydroxamate transport system substrate-binding protein
MQYVTDMLHRNISLPDKPQRIISLVPSQTELLHDLGLETEVVGITKFCAFTPKNGFTQKQRLAGQRAYILKSLMR